MQQETTLSAEEITPITRFVRTSANAPLTEQFEHLEYVSSISETVPDMTIDLRSMINRRQNGMTVPHMDGGYSEEDYPEVYKMDEVELMQYRLELAERMESMSHELHAATKKLEEQQQQESKNLVTKPQEQIAD